MRPRFPRIAPCTAAHTNYRNHRVHRVRRTESVAGNIILSTEPAIWLPALCQPLQHKLQIVLIGICGAQVDMTVDLSQKTMFQPEISALLDYLEEGIRATEEPPYTYF